MKPLVIAIALLPASSFAMPVPPKIKARYDALLASYRAKEFAAFKSFFAPDYRTVDPKGNVQGYKAFVAGFDDSVKGATKITAQERFLGASESRGTVMVKCEFTSTIMTAKGTNDVREVCTDYWRKIGGRWLLVKTADTLFTLTPTK